jgi:hypothetical protein
MLDENSSSEFFLALRGGPFKKKIVPPGNPTVESYPAGFPVLFSYIFLFFN